jgi:hypothetical protein
MHRFISHPMTARTRQLGRLSLSDVGDLLQRYVPLRVWQSLPGRKRSWPPLVTLCAFLQQVLNPEQPCREVVRASNAARYTRRRKRVSGNTSAYCQARQRLTPSQLSGVWGHLATRMEDAPSLDLWKGRRVGVVDGTGLSMPDTHANQRRFPQPSEQAKGCGFPVVKLVALFSLATGAIHGFATSKLRGHERTLFHALWDIVHARFDVILGDRGFCSFGDMYMLKKNAVDTVFRLHGCRMVNWRTGVRLGKYDRLVEWEKPPSRPSWMSRKDYKALPRSWTVRMVKLNVQTCGFRAKAIILATTLLDAEAYPVDALAELYMRRWSIELWFRHIKTTQNMDVLRCLSPDMIMKEIHMHWIAYNLIRTLMLEAAIIQHVPLSRISFKGTVDTLRHWIPLLCASSYRPARFRALYREMLRTLARDQVPFRPHRSEPRALKRRPKKFHHLNKPRHKMGHLPHRNHNSGNKPRP